MGAFTKVEDTGLQWRHAFLAGTAGVYTADLMRGVLEISPLQGALPDALARFALNWTLTGRKDVFLGYYPGVLEAQRAAHVMVNALRMYAV